MTLDIAIQTKAPNISVFPEKTYNYNDYLSMGDDFRCEIIEGRIHEMSPGPNMYHQTISCELLLEIGLYLRKADSELVVRHAPCDVRLFPNLDGTDETIVQPDILVLNKAKLGDKAVLGAPDLVVEIISKSTSKNDLGIKFRKYREAGVLEYWVIFPEEKHLQIFYLKDGEYIAKSFTEDDEISSLVLPDFKIKPKVFFAYA